MPKKHSRPRQPGRDETKIHRKVSDEQLAEAIIQSYGAVTVAARSLGITPRAIYHRCEQNPELRSAILEAREGLCDLAQLKLVEMIHAGDAAAVIFALKCLGKGRGFIERPTDTPPPTVTVNLEINQAFAQLWASPGARDAARSDPADLLTS